MSLRTSRLGWSAVLAVLLVAVCTAAADVPLKLNYQVMLTDEENQPLPGAHTLIFRIFGTSTGGTELWNETQMLEANSIGVVSAVLGSETPMSASLPDSCWLQVEVDGETLTPRRELVSSPYALRAADADQLGGLDAGSYALVGHNHDAVYVNEGQADGVTTEMILPSFVGSVDGVVNDGGNIDLVGGPNISITPDDGANTITISASGGDDGDWTQSGGNVYRASGGVGIGIDPPNPSALHLHRAAQEYSYLQITNSGTGSGTENGLWVGISPTGYPMIWDRTGGGVELVTGSGGMHIHQGGLDVDGYVTMDGFRMDTDPVPGLVLTATSDAGYGSWLAPVWYQSGSDAYREYGNVGIGTTTPGRKLEVRSGEAVGAMFVSTHPSDTTRVLHAEYESTFPYDAAAVYGKSVPRDFYGFGGFFVGGYRGVQGQVLSTGGYTYTGVYGAVSGGNGSNTNFGVRGYAYGPGTNIGVYGYASVDGADDYAGYFDGPLYSVSARTGVGGFRIDHPLNPEGEYLSHSGVESPDMKNVYDGVAMLDGAGEAWVDLPEWFETLNRDFRYQLTAIGTASPDLHIATEISSNRFRIAGGKPGMKVSWQVTGIRQDPLAEAHRIQVEEPKSARYAGKYLNPEVYGLPRTAGIGYVEEKSVVGE